jgi:hypothetical protein
VTSRQRPRAFLSAVPNPPQAANHDDGKTSLDKNLLRIERVYGRVFQVRIGQDAVREQARSSEIS